MNEVIIVSVIGCLGSVAGSLLGVIASSNLTQYRLKQLEEKVEKHNSVIERMFEAEGQITELQHEVVDLKKYHMP